MLKFQKVTSLPQTPDPDSVYFVRVGSVCNMYTVSNNNEYVPLTDPFVDKEIESVSPTNNTISFDVSSDSIFFIDISEDITTLSLTNCNTSHKKVTLVCRQSALESNEITFDNSYKQLNSTGGIDNKLSSISIIELQTYNSGIDWIYTIYKDNTVVDIISSGDILSNRPTGDYYANNMSNTPDGLDGFFSQYNTDENNSLIVFTDTNDVEHKIKKVSGVWDTDWTTSFCTSNSINAKSFGLGIGLSDNAPNISNYNTVNHSGFYGSDGNEVGAPINSSIATSIVTKDTGNRSNIITVHADEIENNVRVFASGGLVDGNRTNWVELYHNQNLTLSTLGGVPVGRKINNKDLSADITLTASDVNALPNTIGGTVLTKNSSGFTASKLANVTEHFLTSTTNQSISIDENTFGVGDKLIIAKIFQSGSLTITSGKNIHKEDGTTSLNLTISDGFSGTIELYFDTDGTSYLRTY